MENIIYNIHNIEYYLNTNYKLIINSYFFVTLKYIFNNKRINIIFKRLKKYNIPINFVNKNFIEKKIKKSINYKFCIFVKCNKSYKFNKIELINKINNTKNNIFILFEDIIDPRNLGSCLRNADVFNVSLILLTKKSSPITDTVKNVSSGAINNVNIMKINDVKYIFNIFKKHSIKIIGTSDKSKNILYNNNLKPPILYVFGSENKGISNKIKINCDLIVKIPTYGYVNSLNISVSVGICLFESIRQKNCSTL